MGFFRKLTADAGHATAGRVEDAVTRRADKVRQGARDIANGGRYLCSCGEKGCPGRFPTLRQHKAHAAKHGMVQAGRWTSKAARDAGRKMGKGADNLRRHAISFLEAAGLKEWQKVPIRDKDGKPRTRRDGKPMTREVPVDTDRARSRPELGARPKLSDLRQAHRHDRDHEKADGLDRKAVGHEARGRLSRADGRRQKAEELRGQWSARTR